MIVESKTNGGWCNYPSQCNEQLPKRTPSAIGPTAYQRVAEWNKNSWPSYNSTMNEASKSARLTSQNRWQDAKQLRLRSSQSMPFEPNFLENDDVTPWDSVSVTSSRNGAVSQRDSGTFDMYLNDNKERTQNRGKSENWDRQIKSYHTSKPNRLSSTSSFRKPGRSVSSHDDRSNSKLLSCIDSLEYLSKKLENVTRVSSEIDKFRMASENITSQNSIGPIPPQEETEGFDWKIGDDLLSHSNKEGRHRRRSYDSTSTDSGVNSNNESGQYNFDHPHSQFDSQKSSQRQRLPTCDYNSDIPNNKFSNRRKERYDLHANNSVSSGYSSEASSLQNPPLSGGYASQHNPLMYNGENVIYPNTAQGQSQWYDYEEAFPGEDPYGYGTFSYASSSVYDEELHQNNGWFYLPTHEQDVTSVYQTPSSQQNFDNNLQQNVYASPEQCYSGYQPFHGTENNSYPYPNQMWPGANYGSLSGTFLNPMEGMSPLSAAISATCAKDHSSIGTSQEIDANAFESKWNQEKGMPTANSEQGEGKKRKSVRFSQTVRERIEKNELEIEDTTSIIKGEDGDGADKAQEHCASSESTIPFASDSTTNTISNEQPIYNIPTGHIASSCMCSDCCLARSASNQLISNSSLSCY